MSVIEKANLVIYRLGKKGLEILLVKTGQAAAGDDEWQLPTNALSEQAQALLEVEDTAFALDPLNYENTHVVQRALAIEDSQLEAPTLKSLLKEDLHFVKNQVKEIVESEQGTYFAVKEAIKKVMPAQYAFLKELKDIVRDRNSVRDL